MRISSFLRFLLYVVVFLSSISFVFSTCAQTPSHFEITSGGNSVGEYSIGEQVHIKANLEESPLEIVAVYESSEPQCFENSQDMRMRLTSSSTSTQAQNYVGEQVNASTYENRFSFQYSPEGVVLENYFQMQYSLQGQDFKNGVKFFPDNSKPKISVSNSVNKTVVPGTNVSFEYSIKDDKSGLRSVFVGAEEKTLQDLKVYDGEFSEVLEETKSFVIRATDRVGHQAVKNINLVVDESGPSFSNFENLGYDYDGVRRTFDFSIIVEDEDFSQQDSIENLITADLKEGQSGLNGLSNPNSCESLGNNRFDCVWEKVEITASQTQDKTIVISGQDSLGNKGFQSFTKSIFVDTNSPEIADFYVENKKGKKNIISGYGSEVKVVLEINDQSLDEGMSVYPQFDIIDSDSITENYCGPNCYSWDISSQLSQYKGQGRSSVPFIITVADVYGNVQEKTLNVTIDNTMPELQNLTFKELSDVKDGVLKSNERIDIEAVFKESNFDSESIYGNFVGITADPSANKVKPQDCRNIEDNTYKCMFQGITLAKGPFERNATVVIEDDAGNRAVEKLELEVLGMSEGELPVPYAINDTPIINPLNRNKVMQANQESPKVEAWFEGEIISLNNNSNFEIVNYRLESCSDSFVGGYLTLDSNSPRLYPYEEQTALNTENISEFSLRATVGGHDNPEELQDMELNCTMFVLFRDDDTLYEPGIPLNFTMEFSFYDLPRGDLLRANAADLKEKIEDTRVLGSKFDEVFEIYNTLSQVCNGLSTIGSVFASAKQGWDFVSNNLKRNALTYGTGKAMDEAGTPTQGTLSELGFSPDGPASKFCRYLTCDLGTIPATTDLLNSVNGGISNWMCSGASTPGSNSDSTSSETQSTASQEGGGEE